jgi:hypothetical protein
MPPIDTVHLRWIPSWHAYAVHRWGHPLGLVRFCPPYFPFKAGVPVRYD